MASTISLEAVVYGSLPLYATYTEVKCDRTAKRESILEQIANARRMPEDSLRNAQIFLVNPPIPLEERVNSKMVIQEQVLSSWLEHLSSVTALEFPRFFSPWPGLLERQYTLCFLRPLSECIPSDWDMGVFQTPGHINAFVVGPVPGTKRIGDSGASSSSPSKRPRTDSEVPEEEASITASISESTVIPDDDSQKRLREKAESLVEAIKESPLRIHTICDPFKVNQVIFPSFHRPRDDIVCWSDPLGEHKTFRFRGRQVAATISQTIQGMHQNNIKAWRHAIFGTYGAGANYLAIAAATCLLAESLPIVFLPMTSDPRNAEIRNAILVALSARDDLKIWIPLLIKSCNNDGFKGLIRFCNHIAEHKTRLVFLFLDFHLAQDADLYTSLAKGHVTCMTCMTCSPNNELCKATDLGRFLGVTSFHLKGGLQSDEEDGWWSQYEAELGFKISSEDKETIFAATGGIPRLLENHLSRMQARGSFHADDLVDPRVCRDIYKLMKERIEPILTPTAGPFSQVDSRLAKQILSVAMTGQECCASPWLTDRRFLFEDSNSRWRCPSECTLRALRWVTIDVGDFEKYVQVGKWRDIFRQSHSMLGFAVEYAVTIELFRGGLVLKRKGLKIPQNLPLRAFRTVPDSNLQQGIWVPVQFKHAFVDCVAVWQETNGGRDILNICPIKITISEDHSDSRQGFFRDDWDFWRVAAGGSTSIKWSFLRVNGKFDSVATKANYRGSRDDGSPPHCEYKVGVDMVSAEVGAALKGALQLG